MKEALRAQKNVGRFVGSEECNMVGRGGISRAFFVFLDPGFIQGGPCNCPCPSVWPSVVRWSVCL